MREKRPSLSSRDVERILGKHGFELKRKRGSHLQYIGFIKGLKRRVTIIVGRKDLHIETVKSMIRQSGLTEEEWYKGLK